MTPLPLLIWDIDDVLNDLMSLFCATVAQRVRPGITAAELLTENPPLAKLGCSLDEYRALLDECRAKFLFRSLPPFHP